MAKQVLKYWSQATRQLAIDATRNQECAKQEFEHTQTLEASPQLFSIASDEDSVSTGVVAVSVMAEATTEKGPID